MSPDKKQEYLNNPIRCPYCNAKELKLGNEVFGEGELGDPRKIWIMIECLCCDKTWSDHYVLEDSWFSEDLEKELLL